MRAHEIDLQLANLVANDVHVAEFADSGCNGVRNLIVNDEFVDDRASAIDGFAGVGIEEDRASYARMRYFAHGFKREVVSVDVQSVQGRSQFSGMLRAGSGLGLPTAAQNAFLYFSGRARGFIFESATMCVVSPSANNSPVSAF